MLCHGHARAGTITSHGPQTRGTVAEQEYLEMLFWLFEAGLPMTGANLARAMQLSAPTVHEMLGRLERDGYIQRNAERTVEFTASGREHAEQIVSRHRMIERFLTDVVGVPWDDVHEEAEQLEHAMTPRFEAYVRASVGRRQDLPSRPSDPGRGADRRSAAGRLRARSEGDDPAARERGRGSPALPQGGRGSSPGCEGEVDSNDGESVSVRSDGAVATVTASVAETVSVVADPSPPPRTALPEQLVLGRERYGR